MSTADPIPASRLEEVPAFLKKSTARVGQTKADAAYIEIRARILSCDLPPGSAIDQELLSGWLGSSTTPVREALRRLEAERLVLLRAHSEVRVAPVSIEEFREFHSVRVGLEPLAAEEAAVNATDAEVAALRELVESSADASTSSDLDRSRSFHRAIYTASHNVTMTQILDNIWDRAGRYRVLFARVGSVPACDSPEHLAIVEAISARDRERVGPLVREDLETTFRKIMPIFEEAVKTAV